MSHARSLTHQLYDINGKRLTAKLRRHTLHLDCGGVTQSIRLELITSVQAVEKGFRVCMRKRPACVFQCDSKEDADFWIEVLRPAEFSDFTVIRRINSNPFSVVYQAIDNRNGRAVALKKVKDRPDHECDIESERQILETMAGHWAPRLYYFFETAWDYYFALELLPTDLAQAINSGSITDIRTLLAEIVTALQFLHANGIVHRDFKASNILLDKCGHVRLTDFGLSVVPGVDRPARREGTLLWAAPETFAGATPAAAIDWWGLGVLAYMLMFGKMPFNACSYSLMANVIENFDPMSVAGCTSDEAESLVRELLMKWPCDRMGTGNKDPRRHQYFEGVNWDDISRRRQEGGVAEDEDEDEGGTRRADGLS
jgi:serine/threonine protein kinase